MSTTRFSLTSPIPSGKKPYGIAEIGACIKNSYKGGGDKKRDKNNTAYYEYKRDYLYRLAAVYIKLHFINPPAFKFDFIVW